MKILIVDDDQTNRGLFRFQVKRLGFDVGDAASGEDAVAAFAADPDAYDLVLMDIRMPGMDGFETARRIREATQARTTSLPILALTAHMMRYDQAELREAGLDGHLTKPISQAQLRETLDRWLPSDA